VQQVPQGLWQHAPAAHELQHWGAGTSLAQLHGGAPRPGVAAIARAPDGRLTVTDVLGNTRRYPAVLVTCQSWLLTTQIRVEESLLSHKLWMALDRTRYMQSSKTFVMVDRPFWNDLRADGWPVMGMTLTDRLTRGTYLFDNGPDQPGVICLSYAWMSDALKMLPHPTHKRVQLALSALKQIYPDVDIASHVIGDPISVSWEADPHFLGAFKGALPGHYRYNHRMYGHFLRPVPRWRRRVVHARVGGGRGADRAQRGGGHRASPRRRGPRRQPRSVRGLPAHRAGGPAGLKPWTRCAWHCGRRRILLTAPRRSRGSRPPHARPPHKARTG
jgi:hypothetical protein